MNYVSILGTLVKDVEVKFLTTTQVANFTIAENNYRKNQAGEKIQETNFFDCVAFGKTAENLQKFFRKGSRILIQGKLKQESWQDKETGTNRSKIVIIVNTFDFIDKNENKQQQQATNYSQQPQYQQQAYQQDQAYYR